MEKDKENFYKKKDERAKDYIESLKDTVSFKINELPNPQPIDITTFDQYARQYEDVSKHKTKKKSMLISFGFWCRRATTFR